VGSSITQHFLVQVPGTGIAIVTFLPEPTAPSVPPPLTVLTEGSSFAVAQVPPVAAVTESTPARAENAGAVEDQIVMRTVFPTGKESDNILLPPDVLDNLPGYLKRLPDGRYRVYYVQGDTRRERLIIDVNVRQGRPVDAGDDSEGTQDRPPSAQMEPPPSAESGPVVLVELPAQQPILDRSESPVRSRAFAESPFGSLYLPDSQPGDSPADSAHYQRPDGNTPYRAMNGHVAIAALAWAGARQARQNERNSQDDDGAESGRRSLSKAARLLRRLRKDFDGRLPNFPR
jgi:hypothetical protein